MHKFNEGDGVITLNGQHSRELLILAKNFGYPVSERAIELRIHNAIRLTDGTFCGCHPENITNVLSEEDFEKIVTS